MNAPRAACILVVDDNDDDIELLRLALARAGQPACGVVGALSTRAARALLAQPDLRPDLVLLDWKMPEMDGADFLRAVRADPRTVGLAVLVFSSSDDPADVREAYAAGATAYVLKPPGLAEYELFARNLYGFWCQPTLRRPGS